MSNDEDKMQGENPWLRRARNAYDMSTDYYTANHQTDINDSIRMFNNEHPGDSKYLSNAFKYRSKIFRPKTRSAIRKSEAAAANAFFSGMDAVSIDAVNDEDPESQASADVMKYIMDYRLNNTMPWFQTVIGAVQDANKTGVVFSYNYWKYKTIDKKTPIFDDDGNQLVIEGKPQFRIEKIVKQDRPDVKLIPVEYIRIHPGSDWIDPINSSPFVIERIPIYLGEVLDRMNSIDEKTGESKWKKHSEKEILNCKVDEFDLNEQTRNQNKQSGKAQDVANFNEYSMVWVHRNIIDVGGEDYVYYTLGTKYLLTDPKPLIDVYWHGERPYTMGCVILETHKYLSQGSAQIGRQIQEEINEVVNSRLDNVKLVLNKRYIVKRGSQTDLTSITRNVAGSVTMSNDVGDVVPMEFQDVTSSAYAEQDRLNLDHDDLVGNFSQSSVQSNRRLNETVGGMSMLQSSSGQMSDYSLRTLSETWLEPTLRQLLKLIAKYETDQTIMSVAMKKAKIMPRYGIDAKIDDLLNKDLVLKVDVGLGSSNPQFKMERFIYGVDKFAGIAANAPPQLDLYEVAKELWSYMGYKSGDRFMLFDDQEDDPKYQQLNQTIQQMQQIIQQYEQGNAEKMQLESLKQENENQRHQQKIAADLMKEDLKEDNKVNLEQMKILMKEIENARKPGQANTGS